MFLKDCFDRTVCRLNGFFLSQQDRLGLWLPVVFGAGIGCYFALPFEPPVAVPACFFIASCFLLFDCRKNKALFLSALYPALFAGGFFLTQTRSFVLSAPSIKLRTGMKPLNGTVSDVVSFSDGHSRLVLDNVAIGSMAGWQTPDRIWLSLPAEATAVRRGDVISAVARLSVPPQAVTPSGYDFGRTLYFKKTGAIGRAMPDVKIVKPAARSFARDAIDAKIAAVLPPETAGVAKALVTGGTKNVPFDIVENYRDAGIAHILSVSGLHMSLLAGMVFAVVRTLLALIPTVALRFNTKKIAAVAALAACFCYLQISGASVPAQRAFIMLAFVLGAVLCDRRALSVVSLGWAAFFILLFCPETLFTAGFQMSFAAVVALVCAYESGAGRYVQWLAKKEGMTFYILSCIGAIVLTTLIASIATAPFTVYNFRRLPVYSLAGNLLSSTVTGVWVMPSLAAATVAMPLGWEKPFLILAGYGISLINRAAAWTASLPDAVVLFPPMPLCGLLCATFGGLWLCLWRGRARWWGLPVFLFSLVTPYFTPMPDMYVAELNAAFRGDDGKLVFREGAAGEMLKKRWMEDNGQTGGETVLCPYGLCVYEKNGYKIGYAHTKIGAYDGCERADLDVLFVAAGFYDKCRPKQVFFRSELTKAGAYVVYATPKGLKIDSVADIKGYRPWTVAYPVITLSGEIRNMTIPLKYAIKAKTVDAD